MSGPTVFIGMESSGTLRERFQRLGYFTIMAAFEAEDGSRYPEVWQGRELGGHVQGDVYECLEWLRSIGRWPDLAVFHPTCTYLTISAEWAYKDADHVRYRGWEVGYDADADYWSGEGWIAYKGGCDLGAPEVRSATYEACLDLIDDEESD